MSDHLTDDELQDALDGFNAWDSGCVSSGISDPVLKARVKAQLLALSHDARRVLLARIGRNLYLTDQKLAVGYGLEDITSFARWLDDEGLLE